MREAEAVTGVCVTGAGSGGAIAQGQGAAASGAPSDDLSWWQQHVCAVIPGCAHTNAATAETPERCSTSAVARSSRVM